MKPITKIVVVLVIVLVIVFGLYLFMYGNLPLGLGSLINDEENDNPLIGTWEIITFNGFEVNSSFNGYIEFKSNGDGLLYVTHDDYYAGISVPFSWLTISDNIIGITDFLDHPYREFTTVFNNNQNTLTLDWIGDSGTINMIRSS